MGQYIKNPRAWAVFFLAGTLFLLTLWRFGANQCLAIAVAIVLLTPSLRRALLNRSYLVQPAFVAIYLLLVWALITVSYSQAPGVGQALSGVKSYAKLLLFLLIPLVVQGKKSRYALEEGLILGVLINVVLSIFYFFHYFERVLAPYISMGATFTINPLQLIFVVVVALWLLATRFAEKRFAWHDGLIFVILLGYLLFINLERSGYLLFIALLLVFSWQYGNKKWFLGVVCLLPILCVALYFASPIIHQRVNLGVSNVRAFTQVNKVTEIGTDNSLGLRLAFAVESFQEIKLHPLLGTGSGSFKTVYDQKYNLHTQSMKVQDPHNAYTYAAFELGLIGLVLYLYCLYRLYPKDRCAEGIWWAFMLMGFLDSGLVLNAVALSFILLAASNGK